MNVRLDFHPAFCPADYNEDLHPVPWIPVFLAEISTLPIVPLIAVFLTEISTLHAVPLIAVVRIEINEWKWIKMNEKICKICEKTVSSSNLSSFFEFVEF